MMTKKIFVMLILVVSCLLSIAARTEGIKIEIRTIGIPPYGIENASNRGGIYYDIANLLAQKSGYSRNNYIYPYVRIINELKTGQTDMTIMFKYEELNEHVEYIGSLPPLRTVVIGKKGTSFTSIDSLKGKFLAYLRGANFNEDIDNDPEIIKQVTDNFGQGVKMLISGRVDGIIGPLDPILDAANAISGDVIEFGKPLVVDERTPWVQVSKESAKRLSIEKLKSAFIEIQRQGSIVAIQKEYGIERD